MGLPSEVLGDPAGLIFHATFEAVPDALRPLIVRVRNRRDGRVFARVDTVSAFSSRREVDLGVDHVVLHGGKVSARCVVERNYQDTMALDSALASSESCVSVGESGCVESTTSVVCVPFYVVRRWRYHMGGSARRSGTGAALKVGVTQGPPRGAIPG